MKIKRQKGVAAVELTLVLPIILLMFFIAVDFGRIMYDIITTTSAARVGAGYSAQSTSLVTDSANTSSIAQSDAISLSINSGDTNPISVSSRYFCRCTGNSSEVACSTSCGTNLEVYVEVTTTRSFQTVSNFPFIPESVSITRTATIRAQ